MRVVCAVLILMLFVSTPAWASGSPVVLRGMSAVPSAGSEWIAVENTTNASSSAQIWSIRDVQGSVKTFVLPSLSPYELRMFSGVETKISLNNTGDQVELVESGAVAQSSAPYEELVSGSLWVLLSTGWQEVTQEEWERRWPLRDWFLDDQESIPSPAPSTQVSPAPSASPKTTASLVPEETIHSASSEKVSKREDDWWQSVALPHNEPLASVSAILPGEPPVWEREPGNFEEEYRVFVGWKRKIGLYLALCFSFAIATLALSAAPLYRCYNDVCLFDDG
jgi:hypothetical protein